MVTTWYTSDLHLGHSRIIELCGRPFADVDEMNAALVDRWNAVVQPGDHVWVLGDVSLTTKALGPVAQLNGRKTLVAGNHDSCWHRHKGWRRKVDVYRAAGFSGVISTGIVYMHRLAGGIAVQMSHLPYSGDSGDTDRYVDYRPTDNGLPLICGHVHEKWKTHGKMINVGVDVWDFTPVHEDVVVGLVRDMYRIP